MGGGGCLMCGEVALIKIKNRISLMQDMLRLAQNTERLAHKKLTCEDRSRASFVQIQCNSSYSFQDLNSVICINQLYKYALLRLRIIHVR